MRKLLALLGRKKAEPSNDVYSDLSDGPAAASSTDEPVAFVPQNAIEQALMRAADDMQAWAEFSRLLMGADLIFATPEPSAAGDGRKDQSNDSMNILSVPFGDGTTLPALFTSAARVVEAFGPGVGHLAMEGRAALEIVASDGAVLNPASTYGVAWSPEDLGTMLELPVPRTIAAPTQVQLGTPSRYPQALVDRIQAIVDLEPRVEAAWLALATWPDTDHHSWYLDVRTSESHDKIVPLFARVGEDGETEGMALDIVLRSPGHAPGTGIEVKALAAR